MVPRRVALQVFRFLGGPSWANRPSFTDQVILGTLLGAVMGEHPGRLVCGGFPASNGSAGYGFRRLLNFSHDRGLADRESFVAQYLALAVFTIGVASCLGMDDLLAAFAAGMKISWSVLNRSQGFLRHVGIMGWQIQRGDRGGIVRFCGRPHA